VKIQKGKIAKAQIATGEHSFTQDELKKIFHSGDVKQKAILNLTRAFVAKAMTYSYRAESVFVDR